ncbi:MAG: hypothetical protein L6282_02570 [Candidatus Methanoperedenaceae archaeon]|nr:hypothetical protein [Candidatus Methanoperedenaceae archaeon]
MWDIKIILKDFIKTKDFQQFINLRFKDDSKIIISKNIFKYISTDEAMFYLDDMIFSVEQVNNDYSLEDLRSTDVVLDIGAFSLKVCKKASRVFAVEPIMTERLKQNINLNNVKNITVLDCALGDREQELEWDGRIKKIRCLSLSEIIKLCGGHIDFFKCDCEGSEWCIRPEELQGVRRLEMEVHNFNGKHDFKDFLKILSDAGFLYKHEVFFENKLMLIHAQASVKR